MDHYKNEIKEWLVEKIFDINQLEKLNKILYGTFGYHDSEPPHSIMSRKIREVEINTYGLWGSTISEKGFDRVIQFCNEIEGDVYLFLKFTNSMG